MSYSQGSMYYPYGYTNNNSNPGFNQFPVYAGYNSNIPPQQNTLQSNMSYNPSTIQPTQNMLPQKRKTVFFHPPSKKRKSNNAQQIKIMPLKSEKFSEVPSNKIPELLGQNDNIRNPLREIVELKSKIDEAIKDMKFQSQVNHNSTHNDYEYEKFDQIGYRCNDGNIVLCEIYFFLILFCVHVS